MHVPDSRLSEADKASILERARSGKLQTDKVLERARAGTLLDAGSQATCAEITNLVAVDKKALEQEKALLKKMDAVAKKGQTDALKSVFDAETARVQGINDKLSKAISNLSSEQASKCGLL